MNRRDPELYITGIPDNADKVVTLYISEIIVCYVLYLINHY